MCTLGPTHVFPVELKLVLHWAADYKACDVKGRVKLETHTAISVVPIVTSAPVLTQTCARFVAGGFGKGQPVPEGGRGGHTKLKAEGIS